MLLGAVRVSSQSQLPPMNADTHGVAQHDLPNFAQQCVEYAALSVRKLLRSRQGVANGALIA